LNDGADPQSQEKKKEKIQFDKDLKGKKNMPGSRSIAQQQPLTKNRIADAFR